MTEETKDILNNKKIHDLKFELRQQRERIDILEQEISKYSKLFQIQDLTNRHLFEVINILTDVVAKMYNDKEEWKNDI